MVRLKIEFYNICIVIIATMDTDECLHSRCNGITGYKHKATETINTCLYCLSKIVDDDISKEIVCTLNACQWLPNGCDLCGGRYVTTKISLCGIVDGKAACKGLARYICQQCIPPGNWDICRRYVYKINCEECGKMKACKNYGCW